MKTGTLGDVVQFAYGKGLPARDRVSGSVPVYGSAGVVDTHNEALVQGPGVIVGRKGTIGAVHWANQDFYPIDTTYYVALKQKEIRMRYVYYLLKTLPLPHMNTDVAVPGLNRENAMRLKIAIVSLPTQDKVIEILSAYDDLIEKNRRRIQLLEQSARLLYKEWFVHLRFPGHEHTNITNGVPEGWEKTTYSDLFKFLGGFAFKSSTYQLEGQFGIVTIKNVHDARFITECPSRLNDIPEKIMEHCILVTGDILLSLTGNVGRTCIVFGKNYLLNQRVAKVVGNSGIPKSFVYWTFSNEATQKELENLAYGVAQLNLSTTKLGKHKFLRPPLMTMELFAKVAEPIFQQICTLNLEISRLAQARDLLLPRLMEREFVI